MIPGVEELRSRGEIGGRTVQIAADGSVECVAYEPAALDEGHVRIRTARSAISPGTEATYLGRSASNVHLSRQWNADLRLFEPGGPTVTHPITFGYRAAGTVVESRSERVRTGARVWGNWRHTELVAMSGEQALSQALPGEIDWDDAIDIGQMGPIALNAVAFAGGAHVGHPGVVFGAGPIGLLTAQSILLDGDERVILVDRLPGRLEIASRLGFEVLEASEGTDVAGTLKRRFGADGIPVAWECSGSIHALHEAIRTVARQGLVVAVGFYQGDGIGLRLGDEFHHNGIHLASAQIGNPHGGLTRRDLQMRTLELVASRRLLPSSLPSLVYPIDRAAEAFTALARPNEVLQVAFAYDSAR